MPKKVLGIEPRHIAAALNEFIKTEAYRATLGAYIEDRKKDLFRKALVEGDDKQMYRMLGGSQELQGIQDWIDDVFRQAERELKRVLKQENKA